MKTLADVIAIKEKYSLFLDDARPAFEAMDEASFKEFKKHLSKCYRDGEPPPEDWMDKYAAMILPEIFITVGMFSANSQMGSGFVMNRMMEAGIAEIKAGKFKIIAIPEVKKRMTEQQDIICTQCTLPTCDETALFCAFRWATNPNAAQLEVATYRLITKRLTNADRSRKWRLANRERYNELQRESRARRKAKATR